MGRFNALPTAAITDDSAVGGQIIQGSTIFDTNHSAYLSRTPSSAGNQKTYTVSVWVKKSSNDAVYPIFSRHTGNNESGFLGLYLNSDNNIYFTGWSTVYLKTNRIYRDTNAWSHIVLAVDTTQASSSNRIKLYFNGELQTFVTYNAPSQNADLVINVNGAEHKIGNYSTNYFNGQMTEMHFIGGQALDSSYFGYTDFQTGIWRPKRYEGTYGTNGFYLPLDGSHHIGKDMSGNGCDWTPNNLRGTVPLHMATGGLPILNTNSGGTTACPGVRQDPLASNIVLALPLSNRYQAIGTDVHHLIKGSGSPKTLTNTGSIVSKFYNNFYGSSGAVDLADMYTDRIEISASDDFNMGTGDFTIECWIYPKDTSAVDSSLFVTHNGSTYFALNFDPGNRFNIYLSASSVQLNASEGLIEYTKWNHIALVRNGNVVKLYVNGLSVESINHTGSVGYSAASTTLCRIGGAGGSTAGNLYMQDFRIYKGVAKYTDTFTCASTDSSVIPESPSGLAVSRKFRRSLSGSVGFDGSGDKITANSTDFVFGTDDFTIEATVFKTDTTYGGFDGAFIFGQTNNDAGGRSGVAFGYKAGGLWLLQGNGSSWSVETTVDVFPTNQWVHIAVSKSSGTTKYFVNGKLVYTFSTNVNLGADNNGDISIGSINTAAMDWDGHISNFRIIKGTALYTSSFTPPTEPLTNVTNTKLLCCQDKYSVTAKAVGPTLTGVGNVTTSAFSPFDDDTVSRASSYAALNPLRNRRSGSVSQGSLYLAGNNYTLQTSTAIFGPGYITSGKYIWEIDNKNSGNGTSMMYAGINSEFNQSAGEIYSQANKTILSSLYYKQFNQTSTTSTRTNQLEGVTTFLLDVDNRVLKGYYNTTLIFTDTTIPNASTTNYAPFIFSTNDGASGSYWADAHFNFGQRPFIFTPPEGYETISSANIEPSSILKPQKHFESIVYTPNSGNLTVTGLEFKPDLLWFKSRNQGYNNYIFDVVRGTGAVSMRPSDTTPEPASGDATAVAEFLTNGFYMAGASGINDNGSGTDGCVAWAWKGGSPVTSSGGGVRFDGANGTNLHIANHADIQLGSTSNWTIEFWLKRTAAYSDYDVIIGKGASSTYEWFIEGFADGSVDFLYSNNGSTTWSGQHEIIASQAQDRWYHIAVVRNGSGANNFKMYVNGSQTFQTTAFDIHAGTHNLDIGGYGSASAQDPPVVISNLRIVKGTSVYTSNFTPPTSPLTNITNTKLLCCQSIRTATEAAVSPGSITSNGGCHATSLNPFDAYSKDGVGYQSTSAAGITEGTQPLTGASINTKAGFSIVTYNGNSSGGTTIGHGLSQAPEIWFNKSRDNSENWRVYYTTADGSYDFMYLNDAGAVNHSGYALPNATVVNKADDVNEKMVAYFWHSVPGYSKMGSYQGNNSTDGKFVYTGFKPAFVLLKRHTDSANYWEIRDNSRVTFNPNNERLFPNRNDTKSVGEGVDFLNNGFKIRNSGSGSNANDKLYIYMAFAEQPLTTQYGTQSNGE